MAAIKLLSLNCHGYNAGTESYLRQYCHDTDVFLLQETWLSDCTSSVLDNFHKDFAAFHTSAMEDKISRNIMLGRPFGGTAIMVRRSLANKCCRITTDNPRVTSVCMKSNGDAPDVVISSVYMPWNDRSLRHLSDVEATIGCLQSILDRFAGSLFVYGGDFNVTESVRNECSKLLHDFCSQNGLCWLLYENDDSCYTYHSDGNGHYSVLDYFFCSPQMSADNNVPSVLSDGDNMSDHCAISVTVCIPAACKNDSGDFSPQHCSKLLWDKANIDGYSADVCNCLSRIELPMEALQCKECCDESHQGDIEKYYNSIINCLKTAACNNVPTSRIGFHKYWWTPELDELKQKCIDATQIWKTAGKPCGSEINATRLRCKYQYKKAIKETAETASLEWNDNLYSHLCIKDNVGFWKAWRKRF